MANLQKKQFNSLRKSAENALEKARDVPAERTATELEKAVQELQIHQNKRISELEQKISKHQHVCKYEPITDKETLEKEEKKKQKEKKEELKKQQQIRDKL